MDLKHIITLASDGVRLPFTVMERSLRKVGCDLPLRVIPFDENIFNLPVNAEWWVLPEVREWVGRSQASPRARGVMHKYQTLLTGEYLFVDSDVVFLRDPREVFSPNKGFVTCCGHWHDSDHTCTAETKATMVDFTTVWQSGVFNSGQYACDRPLYDFPKLREMAESKKYRAACMESQFHEQPGMNALVFGSGIQVTNLTLPPRRLESSWAGDYRDSDYERYWSKTSRMPCFIHWAGRKPNGRLPIDELFQRNLRDGEIQKWADQCRPAKRHGFDRVKRWLMRYYRRRSS